MTSNKENMRLALHVTSKDKIESITRKGLECKNYEDHPIAKDCSVFFYPLNGADKDIEFTPQNARLRNEDVDDSVYIIANIEDGIVGDLYDEGNTEKYLGNTMKYEEYLKECRARSRFREPEVVVKGNVAKERILGSLNYTKIKKIYEDCYDKNERFHRCDCIEKEIMKIIK
jgi:hypothetical protein